MDQISQHTVVSVGLGMKLLSKLLTDPKGLTVMPTGQPPVEVRLVMDEMARNAFAAVVPKAPEDGASPPKESVP